MRSGKKIQQLGNLFKHENDVWSHSRILMEKDSSPGILREIAWKVNKIQRIDKNYEKKLKISTYYLLFARDNERCNLYTRYQ
jgi:hypothetical protein